MVSDSGDSAIGVSNDAMTPLVANDGIPFFDPSNAGIPASVLRSSNPRISGLVSDIGAPISVSNPPIGGLVATRALMFTILTTARSGEVLGCRWPEIDLDARVWTVPAERMKGGRLHRVPLSDAAMAVLGVDASDEAFANPPIDGFVFARPDGRPLPEMAMWMILRRMNVDCTVHGYRASFRNWAAEQTNFPREVCEAALAHVTGDKTERAYFRSDLFDKRRALMDSWSSFLAG